MDAQWVIHLHLFVTDTNKVYFLKLMSEVLADTLADFLG